MIIKIDYKEITVAIDGKDIRADILLVDGKGYLLATNIAEAIAADIEVTSTKAIFNFINNTLEF
ncbi:MAG: hypothetical protein GY817_08290 [bacterium]|nr:hypothetical protein [bacterium]